MSARDLRYSLRMFAARRGARKAAAMLFARDKRLAAVSTTRVRAAPAASSALARQAGVAISTGGLLALSLASGAAGTAGALQLLSPFALPFVFIGFAALPALALEKRAAARAALFAEEYPAVLLAASSSIKSGLTAYAALERAVRLLPAGSIVRAEVERMLRLLAGGAPREAVISGFARDVRLPELELFRSAFLLVSSHGGRFAPALERLAEVCRDRTTLVRSARAGTATMRMTANVLLVLAPLIVLFAGARSDDYFSLLRTHPVANALGTTGVLLIAAGYGALRRMSNFRP